MRNARIFAALRRRVAFSKRSPLPGKPLAKRSTKKSSAGPPDASVGNLFRELQLPKIYAPKLAWERSEGFWFRLGWVRHCLRRNDKENPVKYFAITSQSRGGRSFGRRQIAILLYRCRIMLCSVRAQQASSARSLSTNMAVDGQVVVRRMVPGIVVGHSAGEQTTEFLGILVP
uniref:Uncharacterized protein n=1 Tax=Candidatus Kentrum sp. LFY TaxID=2126342 RepID=A0A450UAI1_9GAMM|nr:MAG: hypothetical protein BECKLFY1418B_GA0070995_101348 [Candidatus Kentron sp. LFY]